MKKKSHLSLAGYLLDSLQIDELQKYRKSFLFGSILPDCIPSFFTRRHTIEETFDILRDEIAKITEEYDWSQGITREFTRRLGVITHYIADYFTYPHNEIFKGNMKEHITYEFGLMYYLKEFLNSKEVDKHTIDNNNFYNVDSICDFIKQVHSEYLEVVKAIKTDCRFIVDMAMEVVKAVLQMLEANVRVAQVTMA